MRNFDEIMESNCSLGNDAIVWCQDSYERNFKRYFESVDALSVKISEGYTDVTDSELQNILINLPISLYEVSEKLNQLRVILDCIKIKKKYKQVTDGSIDIEVSPEDEAETEIAIKTITSLIERVERQVSYSRELIMGAKKIWTYRRDNESGMKQTESLNDITDELPTYELK